MLFIDFRESEEEGGTEGHRERERFVVPRIIGCFLSVPSPEIAPATLVYRMTLEPTEPPTRGYVFLWHEHTALCHKHGELEEQPRDAPLTGFPKETSPLAGQRPEVGGGSYIWEEGL